jgi:hypothetical protein
VGEGVGLLGLDALESVVPPYLVKWLIRLEKTSSLKNTCDLKAVENYVEASEKIIFKVYDNDFTLIIDVYFYKTFSTSNL